MANGVTPGNLGQTPTSHSGLNISPSRLNTLTILGSFVGMIFFGGVAYNNLKVGIEQSTGFQIETKERLARLDADRQAARSEIDKRVGAILDSIAAQKSVVDGMLYQIGQLQKADENNNNRVDRMADTYNGRFTEMNEKMNSMTTQQALTNQTLGEIKSIMGAWRGFNNNTVDSDPARKRQ